MSCPLEQIKEACESGKRHVEKVLTPEWGEPGFVYVRGQMADETHLVSSLIPKGEYSIAEKGRLNTIAWCVNCTCDENGERIFPDEAMEWLQTSTSPWAPIFRCGMKALKMNGFTEELVKNLEATQSDSSP